MTFSVFRVGVGFGREEYFRAKEHLFVQNVHKLYIIGKSSYVLFSKKLKQSVIYDLFSEGEVEDSKGVR